MNLWYKVYRLHIVQKAVAPRKLMTVAQLAQETSEGCSIWYRRIRENAIPSYRIGGTVRVDRADFEEFLRHARRGK